MPRIHDNNIVDQINSFKAQNGEGMSSLSSGLSGFCEILQEETE